MSLKDTAHKIPGVAAVEGAVTGARWPRSKGHRRLVEGFLREYRADGLLD